MDYKQVREMVDMAVEGLLEGGPGSGRYPKGSGKHPDGDDGGNPTFNGPTIGGSTRAERDAHSKGAGPNHFTKTADKADKEARDTPIGHSQKVKRHKEAIRAHQEAVDKGEEKYAAHHETRIRTHERLMKQAVNYREREKAATRRMDTTERGGFTFKKPSDEELAKNKQR